MLIIIILLISQLVACGTAWKTTTPNHSALEDILISTAADRAAEKLTLDSQGQVIAKLGTRLGKTFVDEKNFAKSSEEDTAKDVNRHYALHAIRRYLSDAGVAIVDDASQADTILEVAEGGLSVDTTESFFGIPQMGFPVPLAGTISLPEVPMYKEVTSRGLAKFAMSFRDAHTGKNKGKSFFTVGSSEVKAWRLFIFIDLVENDLKLPKEYPSMNWWW